MLNLTPVLGGIHKDSSGKLWSIYLAEADDHDQEITELWKGEADSILVFVSVLSILELYPSKAIIKTGLYASVVATFLSLSYNELSPTPGNITNALLVQISQQLANNSQSAANLTSISQFAPTGSAIRVNLTWFLSLVFSLFAALNATLFQQWSRRYLELTRHRVAPHKRARTRAYMHHGIESFKMSRAVKAMPVLLHLSIFLFFIGLIDFLWNANTTIGIWIFAIISAFTVVYLAVTLSPSIYLNCPYSTPLSEVSWRFSQRLFLITLCFIRRLEDTLPAFLFSGRLPTSQPTSEQNWWAQWRNTVKARIDERRKWLKLGLRHSIMHIATEAPQTTDEHALSWTLTVLDDDREFEDFVARVPGFFDSTSVPNASSTMLSLMDVQASQEQFDPVLGSRISDLLETCVQGASALREEMRRNRLRVCMRTLWYFANEYNQRAHTTALPAYVCKRFADPEMTRRIQSEEDLAAHLIGCCFSSLIVRKLTQDIRSRTNQFLPGRATEAELSSIAAILGKTNAEVETLIDQPSAISLAIIYSLTSGEMNTLIEKKVPSEVQDILLKTLDILFADDPLAPPNAQLAPDLVAVFQETTPLGQRLRAPDLRVDRLRRAIGAFHAEVEVVGLTMPEPTLSMYH